jgi:hypothetical protein
LTEKPRFTLYISGGFHITNPNSRIEDLPADPESIDVVFKEDVTDNPPSKRVILWNWLVCPLICLFFKIYLFFLSVAARVGITDSEIVDTLESNGAQVVQTDQNYHRILASSRLLWGVSHWAMSVMVFPGLGVWFEFLTRILSNPVNFVLWIFPPALDTFLIALVLVVGLFSWYLIAGAIMGVFFITGTMESRNFVIMSEIENHVREHSEQSTGCLVVGGAHVSHLKELVRESDFVVLGE